MGTAQVCLVGHDVQPSYAFRLLSEALKSEGFGVQLCAMDGKDDAPTIPKEIIRASQFLFVGMSSSEHWAKAELEALAVACESGLPYGFYSDMFDAHRRAWFSPFRAEASLVSAFNTTDAEDARRLFPKARIVSAGNPKSEEYFRRLATPEEVEEKLKISPGSSLVFVSATKIVEINEAMVKATLSACNYLSGVEIVLGLHPGDPTSKNYYLALIKATGDRIKLATHDVIKGSQILCRAGVLIQATGSLGIEAACKRIPVVDFLPASVLDLREKESGKRTWPLCVQGTSLQVVNEDELSRAVVDVLVSGDRTAAMLEKQKELYPEPNPGESKPRAISTMADAINDILTS